MGGNGGSFEILLLALCAWGAFKGWQFMTGRSEWLDRLSPVSLMVKALCSLVFSWVFAAFAIIKLILGILAILSLV